MTPGIHLVHKPVGPTSFSVVQRFMDAAKTVAGRRASRVCHGGTLDPFASGLLLILVEPATRLFDFLHDVPKVYDATVRWGIETDNGDPTGEPVFHADQVDLTPERLDDALKPFAGWREQVPHATSSKRVGGERAYEKAHRGEQFDVPPSRVYLHEATWVRHDLPVESLLRITVRGGFYVRSMARDLGRGLGCGAHLSRLRRVSIGPWVDPGVGSEPVVAGRALLPWLPSRELSDGEMGELRASRAIVRGEWGAAEWPIPQGFPGPSGLIRAFHRGRMVFLLQDAGETLRRRVELPRGL